VDCPSEASPELIVCPGCNELGCDACGGQGRFALTGCPYDEYIDADTVELFDLVGHARRGLYPCAGGALDQDNVFLELMRIVRSEQDALRPSLGD
jgi:hypothetical protein